MNIYQLKSRVHYINKSFEDENLRKNILSSMIPRSDIFLIDEYFSPISVITKDADYLKVNIYKINKYNYDTNMNLTDRDMHDMTITCVKSTPNPTGYSRHTNVYLKASVINFLNCYLNSEQESRKIKRIKDRMSFLAYAIEYK